MSTLPILRAFIDESGDEGINTGGSRWFIIGAVLVPEENIKEVSAVVPQIRKAMDKDDNYVLRWKKFRSEAKVYVSQQYAASGGFTFACVVMDKEDRRILDSVGLKNKHAVYNYATRYLVERISWFARDTGRIARLTFEHRSNLDYKSLWEYLKYMRLFAVGGQGVASAWIDWKHYRILPKNKSRLLQVADNCCGMVWNGLERNKFGNFDERFVLNIKDLFYRRYGNLFSYGLKFMPNVKSKVDKEFGWTNEM